MSTDSRRKPTAYRAAASTYIYHAGASDERIAKADCKNPNVGIRYLHKLMKF
jgi:hypothetical protein